MNKDHANNTMYSKSVDHRPRNFVEWQQIVEEILRRDQIAKHELAFRLRISPSYISNILSGRMKGTRMPYNTALRILALQADPEIWRQAQWEPLASKQH